LLHLKEHPPSAAGNGGHVSSKKCGILGARSRGETRDQRGYNPEKIGVAQDKLLSRSLRGFRDMKPLRHGNTF